MDLEIFHLQIRLNYFCSQNTPEEISLATIKGVLVNNLKSKTNFSEIIVYDNIEKYKHIGCLFSLTWGQESTF